MAVSWDGDTIVVGPGVYAENDLNVDPSRGEAADLTIVGDPKGKTIIDGGGDGLIMWVSKSSTIRLSTLAMTNASYVDGAVVNIGTLTIEDTQLTGNAGTWGGAIHNWGNLTIATSTLSGNSATWGGRRLHRSR